ncbi:MAG TPA: sucrase ferredoxin [Pyrinomonadaceae bacterium]|nr:sucrase ferredoxin [Pyrinomonadaceae bacterium]
MSRPIFYCSELSRGVAEKTFGTASTGVVWVLVEYPHAWRAKDLADSDLSAAVKKHLSRTIKNITHARLLFIRQERAIGEILAIFVVRSREREPFIVKFQLESYEQLMSLDVAAAAAGHATSGIIMREPLFLVCTHGRRDKCCALFGYALYKSLRADAGDHLWQSSHVGGDRFAANLICFPHGLFYGHVTEEAGRTIVREYREGRLVLEGYRGRSCYGHAAQSAEFFIRRESGLTGLDELHFLRRAKVSEHSWRVEFNAPATQSIHTAHVTGQQSQFQNYVTCHSTEEQRVIQYELENYDVTRRRD